MAFSTLLTHHFQGTISSRLHSSLYTSNNNRRLHTSTSDAAVEVKEAEGQSILHLPHDIDTTTRRTILLQTVISSSFLLGVSTPAYAGIDLASLRKLPVAGDTAGALTRIRQIDSSTGPQPDDSKDIAFTILPNGASYRDYREGKGEPLYNLGPRWQWS